MLPFPSGSRTWTIWASDCTPHNYYYYY